MIKMLSCDHNKGTAAVTAVNFRKKTVMRYWFQFSLKRPWLIPRTERNFSGSEFDLTGFLWFYWGKEYLGVIYRSDDDDAKLKDKKGRGHYVYSLDSYVDRMKIRNQLKARKPFEVKTTRTEDTCELTLVLYN